MPPPQKKAPKAERTDYKIYRESYSGAGMTRESKILKTSSSNWLNSGNALIQRVKNGIFVLPVLPGSADAQII